MRQNIRVNPCARIEGEMRLLPRVWLVLVGLALGNVTQANDKDVARHRVKASSKPALGPIVGLNPISEAGCSLWRRGEAQSDHHLFFLSDLQGGATINVGGRDVALHLVRGKGPLAEAAKTGDRSEEHYRAGDLRVRVVYVLTGFCSPEAENCSVVYYNATIMVKTRSGSEKLLAQGVCGS